MIKKIIPAICRDIFVISFVFLLIYYFLDSRVDGYVRYYFDPALVMIACLIFGLIWVFFEKSEE